MTPELPVPPDAPSAQAHDIRLAEQPADAPARMAYSESAFALMLSQYAVMQIVVAATGLVRNKVVAYRLGPSAFGQFAQLGAVVAAVVAFTSFGMQVSLSRNVARASTQEERQAFLASANGLVLSLSLIATATAALLLASGDLLPMVGLPASPEVIAAACLFLASIPLVTLQTNLLSLLQGILDVKGLAAQRSIALIIATVLSIPLVWFFGLIGAAANFLVLNSLLVVLLGLRCRALGYRWIAIRLDRSVLGVLAAFGAASMVASFAQTLVDTSVRVTLLEQYGSNANGLIQAPLVLATTLQTIVLGSIGSMSLATLSSASGAIERKRTIDALLNITLPLSTLALGLLGLVGTPVIVLLFSAQFAGGAEMLPWILCAGIVQAVTWVLGAPLLASGDRGIWVVLELVWAGVRWVVSIALLPVYGPVAVGMGMLVAIVVHLVLNLVVIGVRYRLRISWRHLAVLAVDVALVAALSAVGSRLTASWPAIIAAGVIWFAYAGYVARATPVKSRLEPTIARILAAIPRR